MIIPFAIVIGLQIQGKPTPLQRRWIEAESLYDSMLMSCHLSFTVPSKQGEEDKRIDADLSKEFESIANASAKTSLSLEAWMLALLSSPRDLKRENTILNHIFLTKSIDTDQKEFFKRWEKCFWYFAHTFAASGRVTNLVDLFSPVPKTKAEKADLLMKKA